MEKKKLLRTAFAIMLFYCMGLRLVYGQEIRTFNIESFILAVNENNRQIKIAEKEKSFIREGVNEARAAYLPQANIQSTYQRNFNDQDMYMEFYDFTKMDKETGDIPITLQKFDVGFKNDFQANFLLEQNILSLRSIYQIRASRIHSKIGELEYEKKTDDIICNAKKMFLQSVLMEYVYLLNQISEQNALDNYKAAQNKFENRLISEMDLLQAKIRWENEIPKTQQARRNYFILLNNLKVVAGAAPSDSIVVKHDFSVKDYSAKTTAMNDVFENREDYQMLAKNIELQKMLLKKEKSEYLPDLKAKFGYSYLCNSDKWKFDENTNKPFYAGVTLTIPIFSGGYRKAQVNKAAIQYDISTQQEKDARQNIVIEVKNLEMKLREEAAIIKSAQSTVETAEKGYKLAQKNTETGLISQLDLRRYSEDQKRAQLNLYYAIYNYECSLIDYKKATGK